MPIWNRESEPFIIGSWPEIGSEVIELDSTNKIKALEQAESTIISG